MATLNVYLHSENKGYVFIRRYCSSTFSPWSLYDKLVIQRHGESDPDGDRWGKKDQGLTRKIRSPISLQSIQITSEYRASAAKRTDWKTKRRGKESWTRGCHPWRKTRLNSGRDGRKHEANKRDQLSWAAGEEQKIQGGNGPKDDWSLS